MNEPGLGELAALVLGYGLGSIPFGLLLTRGAGTADIRTIGSGNIGATNVLRTGRKDLAAATLVLDGLKGTAAVLLAHALIGDSAAIFAAIGAFLGHIYPVWLRFRGGKGVATFFGCLIGLWWPAALAFAATWLAIAFATRFSSAAALTASVVAPVIFLLTGQLDRRDRARADGGPALVDPPGEPQPPHRRNRNPDRGEGVIEDGRDLDDAEKLAWLRLIRSENVGPRTFKTLLDRFKTAEAALRALPGLVKKASSRTIKICSVVDAEAEWSRAKKLNIRFVALPEPAYPTALRSIDAPPPLLAVAGKIEALARPIVGVVGSRNASASGLVFTDRLARGLAAAGYVVASGLARGIDVQGASRLDRDRHRRGAGRGPRPYLSERTRGPRPADLRDRRADHRDADRLGATGPGLSTPQPDRGGLEPRRRRGRGQPPLGLAHHRALRQRAGPRGVRRAWLAPRPACRGHERPDPAGRDALHLG